VLPDIDSAAHSGLFTSTVLNLRVLPTLALRFGRFGKKTDTMETGSDR